MVLLVHLLCVDCAVAYWFTVVWVVLRYYCVVFKLVVLLISIGNRLWLVFCHVGADWLCLGLLWC